MPLFLRIASALVVVDGLTHGRASVFTTKGADDLSFDDFVRNFGRAYEKGSQEYAHRARIFQDSLSQIRTINSRANRSWIAGVHPFMDWTDSERSARLHGYDPSAASLALEATQFAAVQTSPVAADDDLFFGDAVDSFEADAPQVQDQNVFGHCASCWAFAAVEAVEARLMKHDSPLLLAGQPRLSVQALLDCMPRKKSCRGGCQGATPELAFNFLRDVGVPLESNLPYNPRSAGTCSIEPYPSDWVRVRISGWRALPRNQARHLMQALVEDGPVVVTADAHDWYSYKSGIFDGCPKDATPNHSVLARGYGVDGTRKYWLLQNSWGTQWGEEGAIRLLRHDDEHRWCGIDSRTQEGVECNNAEHRNVTVCGMCGLLYDPVVPLAGVVTLGPESPGSTSDMVELGADFAAADADEDAAIDDLAANSGTDVVQETELEDDIEEADPEQGDSDGIADVDPVFTRARRLRAWNGTSGVSVDAAKGQPSEEIDVDRVQVVSDADDGQRAEASHAEELLDAQEGDSTDGGAPDSSSAEFDQDLVEAFRVFDMDSSGFVSAAELRRVMGDAGARLTIDEADGMIHDADADGDDRIDYEEFMKMMTAK